MKHGNKHWEREKLYRALSREYFGRNVSESREAELKFYLDRHFYHWFYSYSTAPKSWRKGLNRARRARHKQILHHLLKGKEAEFYDNYKDAAWWYW